MTKFTITKHEVDQISNVAKVFLKDFSAKGFDFQTMSRPVQIFAILAGMGAFGTIGYYIGTHRIAPLMIYVGCLIPILSFGLASYAKNMEKLQKEYREFADAATNVIALLGATPECGHDHTHQAIASVLYASYQTGMPLEELTLDYVKEMPEFEEGAALARHMIMVVDVIDRLKQEGMDVDEIFKSLDAQWDEDYDALYEKEFYPPELLGETGSDDEISARGSQWDEFADGADLQSEGAGDYVTGTSSEPHIIDTDKEDLNLIV